MSRLLMISTNMMDDPYPVYPLGANLVASAVRQSGYDVELFDLMVDGEERLDAVLDRFKPDYIAFSMRNVDNVNFNVPYSFITQYKTIVEKVKQKSGALIILGGSAYTIFPDQFLAYLGADFGIVGPGEVSLPKLLAQIEKNNPPLERVIYGEVDSSGENGYFLNRESRLADYYLNKGGMLNIYTKRGCPHHCLYCSYPSLEGKRYLFRPPEAVVDEIACLQERCGADFLFFTDSVFNDLDNRYLRIMEEMARREMMIPWTCYLRPAKFYKDQIELMKRTGLYAVEWGTDCACDRTLAGMGKDFCWDDVQQVSSLFAKYEIPGSHFIIFGGPGETADTVREGIKNLEGLELSVVCGGMGVRIFPNTGIYELAKRTGLIQNENQLFEREIYYYSPEIEVDWLNQYLTQTFNEKSHWLFPWAGVAERNSFLHNSGLRGPLWDLLLKRKKR
jgi:radical SAM superfamily enzyme YgiQ (UPF0313 family)